MESSQAHLYIVSAFRLKFSKSHGLEFKEKTRALEKLDIQIKKTKERLDSAEGKIAESQRDIQASHLFQLKFVLAFAKDNSPKLYETLQSKLLKSGIEEAINYLIQDARVPENSPYYDDRHYVLKRSGQRRHVWNVAGTLYYFYQHIHFSQESFMNFADKKDAAHLRETTLASELTSQSLRPTLLMLWSFLPQLNAMKKGINPLRYKPHQIWNS